MTGPPSLLRQVVATGEPVVEDAFISVAGGVERHWIGSAAPLLGADRIPRGAVGAFLDVTERKLAEERLRESEERFRMVVDMAPVLIWMSDASKRCTFFNRVWLEFTGRSLDQALGYGWALDVHPDDRERCLGTYAQAFDARLDFEVEYRLRRHDGGYRWIAGHGVPRFESNGLFAGYIGSGIDITDRKDSEDALRENQQRYTMATAAGAVGVWDWNFETNELYVDPTLKSLLGFEDAEITNRPEDWGSRVHPQDVPEAAARVKACIDGETDVYEVEHRMLHKDGSARWFLSRGSAMRGADGTVQRLVGTKVDITERKRAEEAIRENEAALQASNREIRHLAGSLITAQDAERARIARDLHDDVSQQLAALSIALSGLKRRVRAVSHDEDLETDVASLQQRAIALAESVRHLSHDLHPDVLKHGGLTAALAAHCAEVSRGAGDRGDLHDRGGRRVDRLRDRVLFVPDRPGSAAQRRQTRASPPGRGPAAAHRRQRRAHDHRRRPGVRCRRDDGTTTKAWGWSASTSASGWRGGPSAS